MESKTTVYIVDDDPAVRDSLRWLVESLGCPVETFDSARAFLDSYTKGTAGCLILDVRLPGMSGLQLQKKLRDDGISLPIIIITGHGDIPMAVHTLKAGALHFLEKPFRDQEILDHVQEAIELSESLHESQDRREKIQRLIETLTPREYQIMNDIVTGDTNRVIGEKNGISVKTVEVHRTRIMSKMQADSLAELVKVVLMVELESQT